jgi:hypothetical protein
MSAVRGQASGSGAPFNNDESMEDHVEDLASSGGPPVSNVDRAHWSDENNAIISTCSEIKLAYSNLIYCQFQAGWRENRRDVSAAVVQQALLKTLNEH